MLCLQVILEKKPVQLTRKHKYIKSLFLKAKNQGSDTCNPKYETNGRTENPQGHLKSFG